MFTGADQFRKGPSHVVITLATDEDIEHHPAEAERSFRGGTDGNFAFVGLSQVRESAVFSGIPIRRAGVAAEAGRTDPGRGGVGREPGCAARSVRDGVKAVFLHERLFNTKGAQNHA